MTEDQIIRQWVLRGKPVPPPHAVKRREVKTYAQQHACRILVETGTFLGEMVSAMRPHFARIVSIELSPKLFRRAQRKFASDRRVSIIQGDSGKVLSSVLKEIAEPCLFWLDGHYSEGITAKGDRETPILQELEHIFQHPVENHVILIDDARCFNGTRDYPTLAQLERFMRERRPGWQFEVSDDIIRFHKRA